MADKKNFMTITPRNQGFLGTNIGGIVLNVIQAEGVNIKPYVKFSQAELDNGDLFLQNLSGNCDSFTIKCLVSNKQKYRISRSMLSSQINNAVSAADSHIVDFNYGGPSQPGVYVANPNQMGTVIEEYTTGELLDYYIKHGEPFTISTRAIGIDDYNKGKLWIVTENPSRKQVYENGYVEWELTFTRYIEQPKMSFKNSNAGITNAKKKLKQKQAAAKKAKTKKANETALKKKCKVANLKYGNKNNCVKYMQKILALTGYYDTKKHKIDGKFDKPTKEAVVKFQKKKKSKYKCKTDGAIDNATFKALCEA